MKKKKKITANEFDIICNLMKIFDILKLIIIRVKRPLLYKNISNLSVLKSRMWGQSTWIKKEKKSECPVYKYNTNV